MTHTNPEGGGGNSPTDTHMPHYRKIGGIHWFTIGRYRFAFCIVKPKAYKMLPIAKWEPTTPAKLRTWVNDEHNHFIF